MVVQASMTFRNWQTQEGTAAFFTFAFSFSGSASRQRNQGTRLHIDGLEYILEVLAWYFFETQQAAHMYVRCITQTGLFLQTLGSR